MKESFKKEYYAPMVELIETRVERGFQVSGTVPESQTSGSTEGLTAGGDSYNGNDFD